MAQQQQRQQRCRLNYYLYLCILVPLFYRTFQQQFPKNNRPPSHSKHNDNDSVNNDEGSDIRTIGNNTPVPDSNEAQHVYNIVQMCKSKNPKDEEQLSKEIEEYEKNWRFQSKIREVKGEEQLAAHHQGIIKYLKDGVLEPNWSILELGCAAGGMLREVQKAYDEPNGNLSSSYKDLVGVELVTGWVKWAQEYYPTLGGNHIHIYEGDITEFNLPESYSNVEFDFVMLNDVMEHIMKDRYGCFFEQLLKVTHPGSVIYMHTPTPEAQLAEKDQYFENVLPHHYVVLGMALAGFELVSFEHDIDTKCNKGKKGLREQLPHKLKETKCVFGGWTKYYLLDESNIH